MAVPVAAQPSAVVAADMAATVAAQLSALRR
jgi:hypothetical protein